MTTVTEALPVAADGTSVPVLVSPGDAISGNSMTAEELLALRHKKKPYRNEPLTYEFTRDPELVSQYQSLYKSRCKDVSSDEAIRSDDEYDRNSHILVARKGKLVIGGGRLYVSSPRNRRQLRMEEENSFSLTSYFPELEGKQLSYGDFTRLVVLEDYRVEEVVQTIFLHILRKCMSVKVNIIYAISPLAYARYYRKVWQSLGQERSVIHSNYTFAPVPDDISQSTRYLLSLTLDQQGHEQDTWQMEDTTADTLKSDKIVTEVQ